MLRSLSVGLIGCHLLGNAAVASHPQAEPVWTYKVQPDLLGQGPASSLSVGSDGGIYFTTFKCVYNMLVGICVNATGDLMKLEGATGNLSWVYRFDGAGMTGIGYPRSVTMLPGSSTMNGASENGATSEMAVVLGATSAGAQEGQFGFFAAGLPLRAGAPGLSCDVPLSSGNRLEHPRNKSTQDACESSGACWDQGTDEERCDLVSTAQTIDCADPNPQSKDDCLVASCCWDDKYKPGRCFKGSPKCYAKSVNQSGGWQTARPGPHWTARDLAATRITSGSQPTKYGSDEVATTTVALMECESAAPPIGCKVEVFEASGTSTGLNGTKLMWTLDLPSSCDGGDDDQVCICDCSPDVCTSPPAVNTVAVVLLTCSSKGLVLLALDRLTGKQLWKPQLLAAFKPNTALLDPPPQPIFDSRSNLVFVGYQPTFKTAFLEARDMSTGAKKWSNSLSGYGCEVVRWSYAGALSPAGDALLVWDGYGISALTPSTGAAIWKSSGFTAGNGRHLPGVSFHEVSSTGGLGSDKETAVLVLGNDLQPSCMSCMQTGFDVIALSLKSGRTLGKAKSPSLKPIATAISPVGVGDLWVHGDTSNPPRMHSTIYAIKANFTQYRSQDTPILM
eukprot:CAMPEP_0206487396 /NCGR_PEP_ID=MMETSP0324_2-20121206/41616_1 /ASSEMBLY_ACC=CAM_ASM_000836 /TAXON_ID=2866 /ORGANISM="Crypthecodinium cohnii, Strain Seligo" /LENGTH=618 /DNA_ID=CAMNT_0053965869 /DNA_START=97 /DNA_END=1953 /DNA_ORIENTATION=-